MFRRRWAYLCLLTICGVLFGMQAAVLPEPAKAEISIQDTPTDLLASGVRSYVLAEPKIFWHTAVDVCPPHLVAGDPVPAANQVEQIRRISSLGSEHRTLYAQERPCSGNRILSQLSADADYVYGIGANGLLRLATTANVGDLPELLSAAFQGFEELAIGEDTIYGLNINAGTTTIRKMAKAGGAVSTITTQTGGGHQLKLRGNYLYFVINADLRRINLETNAISTIATGVSTFYPEGSRLIFCQLGGSCTFSNNVYYSKIMRSIATIMSLVRLAPRRFIPAQTAKPAFKRSLAILATWSFWNRAPKPADPVFRLRPTPSIESDERAEA
jgi:hypothetical protein